MWMEYLIKMTPKDRNRFHGLKIWGATLRKLRAITKVETFWTSLDVGIKKRIRKEILNMLDEQLELVRLEERYSVCLLVTAIRQSYTKQMLSTWDNDTHSERLKGYREIEAIVNEYRESSEKRIKKEK